MEWSILPLSVPLISFVINALLGRQPNGRHFLAEIFIKQWFCSKLLCLLCCMLPTCRLEPMVSCLSLIDFNFQLPIDFGSNACFPHNFLVLHHNSMETSWFSLTMHESPFTQEKSMRSSSDTRVSMLLLSIWRRSASALSKKTLKPLLPNWKRLRFLLLEAF